MDDKYPMEAIARSKSIKNSNIVKMPRAKSGRIPVYAKTCLNSSARSI